MTARLWCFIVGHAWVHRHERYAYFCLRCGAVDPESAPPTPDTDKDGDPEL